MTTTLLSYLAKTDDVIVYLKLGKFQIAYVEEVLKAIQREVNKASKAK